MSENSAEKRQGFERWVASLKLGSLPASSSPPGDAGTDGSPLTLDEQATLINRLPKEVIYKLRERDSQRALPKTDDSTAVFTPPPELLARARRFQAPPKPDRVSSAPDASGAPVAPVAPAPGDASALSAYEAEAFANFASTEEEATTLYRPEVSEAPDRATGPSTVPAPAPDALAGDVSRPGDIRWIDDLPSEPPAPAPVPRVALPGTSAAPPASSVAPAERRIRWVAVFVAMALLAGIYAWSRFQ